MSDASGGPGWWQALDRTWHPPESGPTPSPPAPPRVGRRGWWRARSRPHQVIAAVVGLAVVAAMVVFALRPPSQAGRDHDAKSKVCTEAVNRGMELGTDDGQPPFSKSDASRYYDQCMNNPRLDSRGNLILGP